VSLQASRRGLTPRGIIYYYLSQQDLRFDSLYVQACLSSQTRIRRRSRTSMQSINNPQKRTRGNPRAVAPIHRRGYRILGRRDKRDRDRIGAITRREGAASGFADGHRFSLTRNRSRAATAAMKGPEPFLEPLRAHLGSFLIVGRCAISTRALEPVRIERTAPHVRRTRRHARIPSRNLTVLRIRRALFPCRLLRRRIRFENYANQRRPGSGFLSDIYIYTNKTCVTCHQVYKLISCFKHRSTRKQIFTAISCIR